MKRLKLLVAAALLGLPLAACEEGTAPPPVGQIDGQVTVEGEGLDGVSVSLSSGTATTTSGGGYFSFDNVEGGTYTITISGYPADASFQATSAEVTIAQSGQTINRNFSGSWIRTATLTGQVTIEGAGLAGVTVAISGLQDDQKLTDDNGTYNFTGLRAGNYTIDISGFDPTDVAFSRASGTATVAVGETKVQNFEGTYVRESTIEGQVSVDGIGGLADVTVTLQGMGSDEEETTDSGGLFSFSDLRAGEYQLAISGFDGREYGFTTTSATVNVAHGRTENVPFEGIQLRTATIMGQVSVEGEGLADVTVTLIGEGENETQTTNASGQYEFASLPAGNFNVAISGYDPDDYKFATTSQSVTLSLGGTATVPFDGELLRTSGISGLVSVEGMGLANVTVTLAGGDLENDLTQSTTAAGQYAFSGLAEGAYTVSITDYDDVSYNFDDTSMDVDLGDDDAQIVNFDGTHVATASVSGMIYVDEAARNMSFDPGEEAFARAGMVFALAGPTVTDVATAVTGADGSFTFPGLRAGTYQLALFDATAASPDHAYGGSVTGYTINLAVGEAKTQDVPFIITHQTINFSAMLKSGSNTGDALPGATVTVFADLAGKTQLGEATTNSDGMAAVRFARGDMTTVYASMNAAAPYSTSGAMQAVTWDPKSPMHAASNAEDVVNTMADFSFSGATITTDHGGGLPLGGWAISVKAGSAAAAGAPTKLSASGTGSHSATVAAADLPVTYTVSVATNQANTLDGNEKYTATSVTHTHTGLSLPATMDAGMMEVTYTTQTLMIYVHNEKDQVQGYTGNVIGGDTRSSTALDISIAKIERTSGRSRAVTGYKAPTPKDGVYTFTGVPANDQIIVQARKKTGQNVMLLGDYELDAYTNGDANGMMYGSFGDESGYNHTVALCPLMSKSSDQRHGDCGTYAYVNTYAVSGMVTQMTVARGANGTFGTAKATKATGVTFSMTPVSGENLAGKSHSYTSGGANDKKTAWDDSKEFNWGMKAAGEYTASLSSGWTAAPANLSSLISPLGDDLTTIAITPTTGYVYGIVEDSKGFRIEGATVTANGKPATTDAFGRYIISGVSPDNKGKVAVSASMAGFARKTVSRTFAANAPDNVPTIKLSGSIATATVAGTVRVSGAPVKDVVVTVTTSGGQNKKTGKTNAAGAYSLTVAVGDGNATITPSMPGRLSFAPESHTVTVSDGLTISGLDFAGFLHATLSGRVLTAGGRPFEGVTVTATQNGGTYTTSKTTDVRGVFTLSVPFGRYTVSARKAGYAFASQTNVNAGPGEAKSLDDFKAVGTHEPSGVVAIRDTAATGHYDDDGSLTVSWTRGAVAPDSYTIQTCVHTTCDPDPDDNDDWQDAGTANASDTSATASGPGEGTGDGAFKVRVVAVKTVSGTAVRYTATGSVAAVNPAATLGAVTRYTDSDPDSLIVNWTAIGNRGSEWYIDVSFDGGKNWYEAAEPLARHRDSRRMAFPLSGAVKTTRVGSSTPPASPNWNGALQVRMVWRQGSTGAFTAGTPKSVAAKGS